jgi:thiol-disulfide isomerase/thioredoxin
MSSPLDTLNVHILDENDAVVSLNSLRQGTKAMVLDFWTTKCVKCPAALEKLNEEAEEACSDDVVYVSCALSQGEGNKEMVRDLVGDWGSMTHVFMDLETKERAKTDFGFTQVPFYVVISKDGDILGKGSPSSIDHKALLATATKVNPAITETIPTSDIFTLDEDF